MNIKKIAFITALLMLFASFSMLGYADTETEIAEAAVIDAAYEEALYLLEALEIRGLSAPEKEISYSNFEDILSMLLERNGVDYDISVLTGVSFGDDTRSNGISGGDLVRSLVNLLGYKAKADVYGGNQAAYFRVATQLGITDGTKVTATEEVLARDVAVVLFHALNTEMFQIVSMGDGVKYDIVKGDTLLSEYCGIRYVSGIVEANDCTNLNGGNGAGKEKVQINRTIYSDPKGFAIDRVGYSVKCYYQDDDLKTILVLYEDAAKNEVIEITKNDFSRNTGRKLFYHDKNGKEKNVQIPGSAAVIYNGVVETKYTSAIFNLSNAEATLIDNDGDRTIDVIKIRKGVDWFVEGINTEFTSIHDRISGVEFMVKSSEYDRVRILDADGKATSFYQIAADDVLTVFQSIDGRVVDLYLQKKQITGKITQKSQKLGRDYVKINDTEYFINSDMHIREAANLTIGAAGVFYLNMYDEVSYMNASVSVMKYGYVRGGAVDGAFGQDVHLRILTDGGEHISFRTKDSVVIDASSVKHGQNIKTALDHAILASGTRLIRYDTADDGLVYMIDTAVRSDRETENTLYSFGPSGEDQYIHGTRLFHEKFRLEDTTLLFFCPTDASMQADENFGVLTPINLKASKYKVQGFGSDFMNFVPEVVVIDASLGGISTIDENSTTYAIKEIEETLDEDGEPVHRVVVLNRADEKEFYTSEIAVFDGMDLEPGDIINAQLTFDEKICAAVKVFDGETQTVDRSYYETATPRIETTLFSKRGYFEAGYVYYCDGATMAMGSLESSGEIDPSRITSRSGGDLKYFKVNNNYLGCIVDSNYSKYDARHVRRLLPEEIKDYLRYKDGCARVFVRGDNSALTFIVIYQ